MSIELQIQRQSLAVEQRPVGPVSTLQREVQRRLGRCLIRLQQVDGYYAELRQWAITMDQARSAMGAFMASPAYADLLFDVIHPAGAVDWPTCGIVRHLRAAEAALAVDGWADLGQVIEQMNLMHPEQTLKRYGCTTWRQVLHASKQFKTRRDQGSAERPGRTEFQSLSKPLGSSKPG